jgi:galactokinase
MDGGQHRCPTLALCRQAENTFVGARVGIMDQFVSRWKSGACSSARLSLSDFQLVPIPSGIDLVVRNTMVKHDLATGA